MKKLIFLSALIVAIFASQELSAQKVKYKDLFPLLNSKNYTLAEPLLKSFIKEEPEHANAHFQMALLYDYKAGKTDILKDKALLNTYIDSAIFYYKKATEMITEKEVKKNEEFYQAYNRRDLRTGKFDIKISDIHLEIEKAIKNLENKRAGAQGLNMNFDGLKRNYSGAADIYNGLTEAYPDINKFYLRSNANTIEKLNQLVQLFDSVHFYQRAYTESLAGVKTTYKQSFIYSDITGFKAINAAEKDFYANEVSLDDFGDWAAKRLGVIETDITRIRKALVDHNAALTQAIPTLAPVANFSEDQMAILELYGDPTFFVNLFDLKGKLSINRFMEDSLLSKMKDSALPYLGASDMLLESYTSIEKVSANLINSDFNSICADFEDFVTTQYKGCLQIQEYFNEINKTSKPKIVFYDSISKVMNERVKWSITGKDSLALFAGKPATSVYQTLVVKKLAFANKQLISGIKPNVKKGSNVFLALITGDYTNEWLTEVDTKGTFELTADSQGAALMEGGYETYLSAVYSKDASGAYKTCLVALDNTGKLKWFVLHSLKSAITKIEPSTEMPGYKLLASDGTFVLVDPTGKLRQ